ncbi:MAG TPA: hypothetical protein VJU15_09190 [Gemmatimonadales bacterium]|nr:hypothetical protein [Gemmatimonadales bacterium]
MISDLRARGAKGGVIGKHRAMVGLDWTPGRVARSVLLSIVGAVLLVLALPLLARGYTIFYEEVVWWVGLPAGVGTNPYQVGDLLQVNVPYLRLAAPWPGRWHWIVVSSLTAIAFLLSFLLPARFLPARYFLRFVAMVQAVSIGYFAFAHPPFLYPLPGYTSGMLAAGMAVLVLVPIVLGFAFYIFDHDLARQLLFTLAVIGHMAVLLPIQVLIHAWLSHYLSALVQPTLFFVFGLLLEVLVFVAFYGWGMSWTGTEIPQTQPTRMVKS